MKNVGFVWTACTTLLDSRTRTSHSELPESCSFEEENANDSSLNRKKKKSNEGRSAKKYSKARKRSDYETQRLIDLFLFFFKHRPTLLDSFGHPVTPVRAREQSFEDTTIQ